MKVRKFEERDRSDLIKLLESVFPDSPARNQPARVVTEKLAVDDLVFIAETNWKIIGACMAGYDGHRGWLYAVSVLPEYRRGGAGSLLVDHATRALGKLGCIKVNLQVRTTNTDVVAFYESLGFAVEERISMGKILE
jgi:ribosomal protein S18 acetylase RimI-like enzyme